ncbi:MAG: hypothetical protein HZA64_12340 [Rhodocyclales bacterium]|nr:hypothetical protein [Rhodocyclales bacterium]MBI5786236.1 hypothetical protein [Rhodocyclales bacterium]
MLVTLAPNEVSYRIQPPVGRTSKATAVLGCVAEDPAMPWAAACNALAGAMAEGMQRRMRISVVLSDRLVRYLVLPWRAGVVSRAEWRAYALHSFESVYGADCRDWRLRIDLVPPGRPSLACAIDAGLIEALRKIAGDNASRLIAVRPNFISLFNQRRAALRGSPLWFAAVEERSVCMGVLSDGVWRAMRNESAPDGWLAALPGMVGRMQFMADGLNDGTLYVHVENGCAEVPASIGGLQVRLLDAPVHRRLQPDSGALAEA